MAPANSSIPLAAVPLTVPATEDSELDYAEHWLRFILYNTILTRACGIDVAVYRALRASLCIWRARPSSTFYEFITTHFPHHDVPLPSCEELGVSSSPITFCLPACARDAPVYYPEGTSSGGYHVADIIATSFNPTHLLPTAVFIPYKTRSPLRSQQVMERVNPIPFWFFREDGILGVPIHRNGNGLRLLHGQDELCLLNSNDNPITTLKIKINWPNYAPLEKQVRSTKNSPLNNLDRLAYVAAKAVCNFMRDVKKVKIDNSAPHRFNIGTLPGEVSVEDVLLLGVIFVSAGAAMPILAVRNDFVFATHSV